MKYLTYTVILIFTLLSCATLKDNAPLKDLPADNEYTIVIQRVLDKRLPYLSEAEFQDMLNRTREYIREHLGYTVHFYIKGNKDLPEFMKDMEFINSLDTMDELKRLLLNPDDQLDRQKLKQSIEKLIAETPEATLKTYVPNYERYKSKNELCDYLYQNYLNKLLKINNIITKDGSKLADHRYSASLTYPFWDTVLREAQFCNFIFANTIMADMELELPLYVTLRYGITTGLVEGNRYNMYRACGIIFTYPFLSKDNFFINEREEQIPQKELTDVIALYSTHEFGHFLNHYKDYYDHKNCIMVPANSLNYYKWYRDKKEKRCGLPHEKLKQF